MQHAREATRERRIINYGWTSDGMVWLAAKAPHSPSSMVVGVPAPLQAFIGTRKFDATLDDGSPCGTIACGDSALYNFYAFGKAVALEEGDVVKMTFDIVNSKVLLEVVDEDALEE